MRKLTKHLKKTVFTTVLLGCWQLGSAAEAIWNLDNTGGTTSSGDRFGSALAYGDFDGDGFNDLAIGVPGADLPLLGVSNAGMVAVLYGSGVGLRGVGSHVQYIWQYNTSDGIEDDDYFGSSLASGDFNGDGIDDLVVGVPNEDVDLGGAGNRFDAGAINIFPGASTGLLTDPADLLYLRQGDVIAGVSNFDAAEPGDQFGRALTVGDFNNDGFDDLAVSAPNEGFGNANQTPDGGSVRIIYGLMNFFQGINPGQGLNQNTFQVDDSVEQGDLFGYALTSGDFNNDGFDDLAVGVPGENPDGVTAAGAVQVFLGSGTGIDPASDTLWSQATSDISGSIEGIPEATDRFGSSLASGDFDGNGSDDLLIGIPNEDINGISNAGAVSIIFGAAASGLVTTGDQLFHQDSPGITGVAEDGDSFGQVVAAGDINYDGYADAIIGVPYEDSDVTNSGVAHILLGTASGIVTAGDVLATPLAPQSNDQFGFSLLAADFGDGSQLAVGWPGDRSVDNEFEAGAVLVGTVVQNPDIIFKDHFENHPGL